MRTPNSLKQEFLKKLIKGIQIFSSSKKDMNIFERKKAIKLSADVATALTRNAMTCWSRALLSNASKDDNNKPLVDQILGTDQPDRLKKASIGLVVCNKRVRSKEIRKRSCSFRRVKKITPQMVLASSIANRLVKKRTQVLKSLVPGGEFMDESSLIKETLDYIISLRAQVAIMKGLANATKHLNRII